MKFKIKNCPDCLWWQSRKYEPRKLCCVHESKSEQPPAIIKEIKKEKKILWSNRFLIGGWVLFIFSSGLVSGIATLKYSLWISIFSLIFFWGLALFITYLLIKIDKMNRDDIKELQKKQNEWIIYV